MTFEQEQELAAISQQRPRTVKPPPDPPPRSPYTRPPGQYFADHPDGRHFQGEVQAFREEYINRPGLGFDSIRRLMDSGWTIISVEEAI